MGLKQNAGSRGTRGTAPGAVGSSIALCQAVWVVLWVLGVIGLWVYASGKADAAEAVTLRVVPKLCVKPIGNEMCEMQISATWTAATAMNVCLKFEAEAEPLRCWQSQRQGEFSTTAQREGNTTVQLLDAQSLAVLSAVEISVIERDLRDTRRRRRHAWSVF